MQIAFVLGCPRSGTSILGELIASHADVTYLREAHHIWRRAVADDAPSDRLTASDLTPYLRRKLTRRFAKEWMPGKVLVEKNPRSTVRVPFIRELFPEAKLIHIIRDGRDVACSLLPGIGGESWNHVRTPNWQDLFENRSGILRCAELWQSAVSIALQDLTEVEHLEVRYESLVAEPTKEAERIMAFLELPLTDEVRQFSNLIRNETEGSYHAGGQKKWFVPDHSSRIGRWQENLTETEAADVSSLLESLLKQLSYPI